jgi:hypothetical protein
VSHSENAHAARVEHGIVRQVIVIPFMDDDDAKITAYCNGIGLAGIWLDTSYLGARRKRYAGVGFAYDSERDEFVPPGWELVDGEWTAPPEPDEPADE